MIAHSSGLKPGKFTHFIGNCHVYDRHLEQSKELLTREMGVTPLVKVAVKDFYEYTVDDVQVFDYEPTGTQLQFELAK